MNERTINEALAKWLTERSDYRYRVVGEAGSSYLAVGNKHAKGATTFHSETVFTRSLDSVQLVEQKLSAEQGDDYVEKLIKEIWSDNPLHLITAVAPTRCRALIIVLELEESK